MIGRVKSSENILSVHKLKRQCTLRPLGGRGRECLGASRAAFGAHTGADFDEMRSQRVRQRVERSERFGEPQRRKERGQVLRAVLEKVAPLEVYRGEAALNQRNDMAHLDGMGIDKKSIH
jgi:hypothetical protein